MHVFLLGVSHQTAPVDVRERLDFSTPRLGAAVQALAARSAAGEAVVLSTCNRSEVYVASDDPLQARAEIVEFLASYHGLPRRGVRAAPLRARRTSDATRHLFRVAAGLDSLVVGEPQILGQVKDAFQVAADAAVRRPVADAPVPHRRSASASGCDRKRRSAKARCRWGLPPWRWRARSSAGSKAAACWSSGPARSATLAAQHLRAQGVGEIVVTSRTGAQRRGAGGRGRRPRHRLGRAGRRARRRRHRGLRHRARRGRS